MDKIRLNKFLAERLGISRREADDIIAAGKVTIDGRTAQLGDRLTPVRQPIATSVHDFTSVTARNTNPTPTPNSTPTPHPLDHSPLNTPIDFLEKVCYNGKIISSHIDFVYLGLNKPVGYVCSRRRQGESPTVFELLPAKYQQLKTVGRLDKDSSGLILLTNDGDFAFRMTHPKFVKQKVYEVELNRPLAPLHRQMISEFGVEIGDGVSRLGLEHLEDDSQSDTSTHAFLAHPSPERLDGYSQSDATKKRQSPPSDASPACNLRWRVTMSEGRNRQIRRTFAALGYTVIRLHRIQFGPYQLSGLPEGKFELLPTPL